MKQSELEKIAKFLIEARKLETIYRFTPKPDGSFESDAEHSWTVALTCMLIAKKIGKELKVEVDELKVLKMALIHDLGEIIVGDYKTWDDKNRIDKEKKERKAVEKLTTNLPKDLKKEIRSLWEECEAKETIEAKIVKSIDRLDPVIHRYGFNLGWENAKDEFANIKQLDKRQIDRHKFSKILLDTYKYFRIKALQAGMLIK